MGLGAIIWWCVGEKLSEGGCLPSVGPTAILFVESTVNKLAYYSPPERSNLAGHYTGLVTNSIPWLLFVFFFFFFFDVFTSTWVA